MEQLLDSTKWRKPKHSQKYVFRYFFVHYEFPID